MRARPFTLKSPLSGVDADGVKNRSNNFRDRLSRVDDAPIGHSFDLVDRRVIELWLGSQRSISLPQFGPARDLRSSGKPGT